MSQNYPLPKPHPFSSSPTANPNNADDNQPQAYTNQDRRADLSRATITMAAPRASNLSQTQLDQMLKLFALTQKHSPRQPCPHMFLYTQQLSPDPKPETSTSHYDQAGGTDSVHDLQRHLIPRNDIKSPEFGITFLPISIASTTHYPTIPVCFC